MGKIKKREKKSKKHKHKKSKQKHKKNVKDAEAAPSSHSKEKAVVHDESGFEIPVELMNTKSHTPTTPQEHQQIQSQMRRVVDPNTGRVRLIRGEGEVMEEIVSKEQHAKINSLATETDGLIFQTYTIGTVKRTK